MFRNVKRLKYVQLFKYHLSMFQDLFQVLMKHPSGFFGTFFRSTTTERCKEPLKLSGFLRSFQLRTPEGIDAPFLGPRHGRGGWI